MDEVIVKEEVIEETRNCTLKNGEYVEVKQEEIEEKPEYLLEKEIKTETIDFYESNEFPEDVKQKERGSPVEKVCKEGTFQCEICQKKMPRNLLKFITSEDDKTVLSEMFKVEGFDEMNSIYVCYSHIQTIIDENDEKMKLPITPYEKLLRSFITKNKNIMRNKTSRRCQVCHILKGRSELYEITSKGVRMVVMIGCILRGSHSVESAMSYVTTNRRVTCYSHFKESIDIIFEHLGVRNIQEFFKCARLVTGGLMDIVKDIDPNFTIGQFKHAFNELLVKKRRVVPRNL
ncbi:unnamed protein product [Caenorhabditis nigoni]|uniref:Lin-15A/B-like domain-containing protein n=1 Tax=Caenorhabditis nigoni TaxID=1611254 RepID=A0A2G5TQL0_9PELO|nr:hypothetical protein B9Z55_021084 [Caenorhabditis nigoni]